MPKYLLRIAAIVVPADHLFYVSAAGKSGAKGYTLPKRLTCFGWRQNKVGEVTVVMAIIRSP